MWFQWNAALPFYLAWNDGHIYNDVSAITSDQIPPTSCDKNNNNNNNSASWQALSANSGILMTSETKRDL